MFVFDSATDSPCLQDSIEFEASILVDWGKGIEISTVARPSEMRWARFGDFDHGGFALRK